MFDTNQNIFNSLEKCQALNKLEKPRTPCIDSYFSLQDGRANTVLNAFKKKLNTALKNEQIYTLLQHPYLKLILIRHTIEYSYQSDNSERTRNFIEHMFFSSTLNYQEMYKVFFNRLEMTEKLYLNEGGRYERYHYLFYQLEFARFFREVDTFINGPQSHPQQDELYSFQVEKLIQLLNIRYKKNHQLMTIMFDRGNDHVPLINLENEGEVFRKIDEKVVLDMGYCDNINGDLKCQDLKLNNGIFISQNDLLIQGNKLSMGPLAMIYAPGRSLTIDFNKMENLWIDVSGQDVSHKTRSLLLEDLESHTLPPVPGHNGAAPTISLVTPPRHRENGQAILSHGQDGNHGGTINLVSRQRISGLSLLVVKGGNGQAGLDGIPSMNCKNGKLEDYVLHWTYDKTISQQVDRSYWDYGRCP